MKAKLMLLSLILSVINMNPARAKAVEEGTLEIVPVKNLKTEQEASLKYNNKSLQPLTKRPILTVENFSYTKRAIGSIELDEKESKDFERAAKKFKGNNFAVVFNGEVVAMPKIKKHNIIK